MPRLRHATAPTSHPGSRVRRLVGGLGQRVHTAVVRGGLGPVDLGSCLGSPVLRDYPYRVDR